jgi:UPF0755 protein
MFKRIKPWWIAVAGAVVALIVCAGIISGLYAGSTGSAARRQWVTIPSGSSTAAIGSILQDDGVVGSGFWFRIAALLSGSEKHLQAGRYLFAGRLSTAAVIHELSVGAARYDTVSVTIPEGWTVRQIAALMAHQGVCSYADFMRAALHDRFPYAFLTHPLHDVRDPLEGYLFPDTYEFLRGESARSVINKILRETARVINPLQGAVRQSGHSLAVLLTVASIVEREAQREQDRPLIASVIYNRLRLGMPLQMNSTVEYAVGKDTADLSTADLAYRSPYNTYIARGLPPGPICDPGLESILAAIHPAHTKYLYYVTSYAGNGGVYYATTYAQQLANEKRSEANYQRLRRATGHKPDTGRHGAGSGQHGAGGA